jgi:adenine deaminase
VAVSEPFSVSGNVVDLHAGRVAPGTIDVGADGRIARITPAAGPFDTYILPGFVDAHIHIESSMLPPHEFARFAVTHGTVATVSDPHEIANVLGTPGVRYMIDSARQSPMHVCFGAPSCVPATPFETAGATLDASAIEQLLQLPEIGYLSEVMNIPGVLKHDPDLLAKLAAAKRLNKPIDGHAPGLRGDDARAYFAAGVSTDHECFTYDEAKEKIALGVHILIREGSAARNFDALWPLLNEHPDRCMLCSDDKHPNDLEAGHINDLVARAVQRGIEPINALRAACLNPVHHYRLPTGLLRPGDRADFIEVDSLQSFRLRRTWLAGQLVARDGQCLLGRVSPGILNRFDALPKRVEDFGVPSGASPVHVIEAADGQLITRHLHLPPTAPHVLKLTVVNRYARAAPPALAHIRGFGLRGGAIASSVAHDSHNVVAVAATDAALCQAVNAVIENKGGLAVVTADGQVESLPLPIAGLMSDLPGREVASRYAALDALARQLGSPLRAPFMTLSFMALLVIPELKLSDRGLFDGVAWKFL